MGLSRVSCATLVLPLLFTSLAHAEPPVTLTPPSTAVPIELHGSEPNLHLEIQDPRTRRPLALCTGACQASIVPGRYRLFVDATPDTRAGGRDVQIVEPSSLLVTPRSEARHTTGLVLGIAGPVLMVIGSVVILSSIARDYNESGSSTSGEGVLAGLGMMLGGIAITPVGWVMFGTSLKPKVEVTPLGR
jgi:hypothetical protein